ncbi:hypothetical protein ACOSQ2_026895 [Xanthoceras sorbifolium]
MGRRDGEATTGSGEVTMGRDGAVQIKVDQRRKKWEGWSSGEMGRRDGEATTGSGEVTMGRDGAMQSEMWLENVK